MPHATLANDDGEDAERDPPGAGEDLCRSPARGSRRATRLGGAVRLGRARGGHLHLHLTEDAMILHDRDGFFAGVLDRMRASLRRLGSKRIREGATWYWDLKPDFEPGEIVEI